MHTKLESNVKNVWQVQELKQICETAMLLTKRIRYSIFKVKLVQLYQGCHRRFTKRPGSTTTQSSSKIGAKLQTGIDHHGEYFEK